MARVSIIIPTFNRGRILPRAIASVLNQTFRDFELIVVDDASSDNTGEVVKGYKDDRIRYIRHEMNKGAPAGRNTGLRHAKGAFVAFLDSDNEWLPEKLDKQLKLFERVGDTVGIVYANNKVVDESSHAESEWAFGLRGNLYREFLQRPFMDFITPLIRRECFEKIGPMDENVPSYQEWDTFLRLSRYFEFDYVPEVLAIYYIHSDNRISKGPLQEAAGWSYVFRKHKPEMLATFSRRVVIEHHRNLAHYYRLGGAYGKMVVNLGLYWYHKLVA